jgi:DNA replication protein DnaC
MQPQSDHRVSKVQKEEFEQALIEKKINDANLPLNCKDYDIATYLGPDENNNIKKLKYYIEHFDDTFKDKLLYIYGDTGTQKTTVASWIGRELLRAKKKVQFIYMRYLLTLLMEESFDNSGKIKGKLENIRSSDVLIIDRSFSKDQVTLFKSNYQIAFLDEFLRMWIEQEQKALIIISNTTLDDIQNHGFPNDIQDFIARNTLQGTALHFTDSYRSYKDKMEIKNLFDI